MTDAALPSAETPAVPPATPLATPAVPPAETVTLPKEEHDRLKRDAARASEAQSRADRLDAARRRNPGHFTPQAPVTPPSPEEAASRAADEDRKAERGLMALALDPSVREVLDADATLRDMLTKNPLAVLPVLAPDAIDAEDAISLVRDALTKRAEGLKKPVTPPADTPSTPPNSTPPTPPAGGVNPPDKPVDAEYEAARKHPNTENAIAGMIKVGIKRQAPQK